MHGGFLLIVNGEIFQIIYELSEKTLECAILYSLMSV